MAERHYIIQEYDPVTKNGCSIPRLNPIVLGKLNELARRYHKAFPDDTLFVTSMSRNPLGDPKSAHNLGWAFDIASEGLKDPRRRQWIMNEADKIGLGYLDEYAGRSKDWTGAHMHFNEVNWTRKYNNGTGPVPYVGQEVPESASDGIISNNITVEGWRALKGDSQSSDTTGIKQITKKELAAKMGLSVEDFQAYVENDPERRGSNIYRIGNEIFALTKDVSSANNSGLDNSSGRASAIKPILEPNRYFLEFEIKSGDGWDSLEAIYGAAVRDLPEYGKIQSPGVKRFQIEVSGSKLAELYYSGKLRPGDRGFAIMGNGGVLSHLSAPFGKEITPDSLAKLNGIEKDWVHPGQSITVFSFPSNSIHSNSITAHSDTNASRRSLTAQSTEEFDAKVAMLKAELTLAENQRLQSGAAQTLTTNEILMTDSEMLESIRKGIFSSGVQKTFAEQLEYNLKLIQGPTSTVSVDATLSYEDIRLGYTLSNINGVLRRVNAAGAMHPDDQYADWQQGEMFERATLKTIADMSQMAGLQQFLPFAIEGVTKIF